MGYKAQQALLIIAIIMVNFVGTVWFHEFDRDVQLVLVVIMGFTVCAALVVFFTRLHFRVGVKSYQESEL